MGGIRLIISRHNRVVNDAALPIAVKAVVTSGGTTVFYRRDIVEIVIHGQYGQCGLRLRFANDFALLIFEVGEITGCFSLGQVFGTLLPLLVPALDNLRDALEDRVLEMMRRYD